MIFYIYKIQNIINNKMYIGITENYERRIKEHKQNLSNNNHGNYKLQNDWNNFEEENFIYDIIEKRDFNSPEQAYDREFILIQNFNCIENGYNIAIGGLYNPMYTLSIKEKMTQTKQSIVPNIYQLEEIYENSFKIIKKYNSQKEAQRLDNYSQRNISRSLKENIKADGYYWIEEQTLSNFENLWRPKRNYLARPTAELNNRNEIIKVHYAASIFEKEYKWTDGIIKSAIRRNGKAHNIKFIYISWEEYYNYKPITLINNPVSTIPYQEEVQ